MGLHLRRVLALALVLACGGCTQVRYLAQASYGQLELLSDARPLPRALGDPDIPQRVRALLAEIPDIKAFGERHGLKRTRNYETYVQRADVALVWVVTACAPLRFRSHTWSFPIVGRVPYLGWFSRKEAEAAAAALRRRGLDVDVRTAGAYSTLGWFRDPIISTMIRTDDDALGDLVNIVLHESVHATVFIGGQTYFNESIATFVGDRLAIEYLREGRGEASPDTVAYLRSEEESAARTRAYHAAYARLAEVYASPAPDRQKLARKARILADLEREVGSWRPINNATLMEFKAYDSGREELQALLDACAGDWPCFLDTVRSVDRKAFREANQEDLSPVLAPLARHPRRRPGA